MVVFRRSFALRTILAMVVLLSCWSQVTVKEVMTSASGALQWSSGHGEDWAGSQIVLAHVKEISAAFPMRIYWSR